MTGPFSRKQIQLNRENYILQVTEEILQEKGFHDMSMDEIASRVGISKVTIYRHFKSKEDIVFCLFFRDLPDFLHNIDQVIVSDRPLLEKIESIIYMSILKFLQKESALSLSVISVLGELPIFLKSKQEEIENVQDTLSNHLMPLLNEGQSEGLLDSSIPSILLYKLFFSIIPTISSRQLMEKSNMSEDELAKIGTRMYMKAITI
ncbi:TetR/AcrR family transcriptional regulator [Oceanobacillus piezotolerans]|uniref:TetR/AcrR family transcriptional regulator n=1 Tax=Oceanobacillus piezotolerans TaxID=2448030 RepID=A0A498D9L0_9BACI|nr:TetR/AcrR family transcriptional regulator [Oceanobacillus piezotolerans]RLL43877.1 TetR/AcrR family transcriptional regulator [Oceanobacillus piezotolerans]